MIILSTLGMNFSLLFNFQMWFPIYSYFLSFYIYLVFIAIFKSLLVMLVSSVKISMNQSTIYLPYPPLPLPYLLVCWVIVINTGGSCRQTCRAVMCNQRCFRVNEQIQVKWFTWITSALQITWTVRFPALSPSAEVAETVLGVSFRYLWSTVHAVDHFITLLSISNNLLK